MEEREDEEGNLGPEGAFISLFMSKWMAKMFHGVQIIDPNNTNPELNRLVSKVHEFARRAQLPKMPEIGRAHV